MAKVSDWQRYRMLQSLIIEAMEDAGVQDDDSVTLAISPDLNEVYANPGPHPPFEDGDSDFYAWYVEHADSPSDALDIADLFFDFR